MSCNRRYKRQEFRIFNRLFLSVDLCAGICYNALSGLAARAQIRLRGVNGLKTADRILTLDTAEMTPSSLYLFGHNLEHMRACVSGGLSAQLLRNRKFAGRPGARTGVAAEWTGIGGRVYFCNDKNPYVRHFSDNGMRRRNETNAQTVLNPIAGQEVGICQSGLYFRPDMGHILAVVVKCSAAVTLHAALMNEEDVSIASARFDIKATGEWERFEAALPAAHGGKGGLKLTFSERAEVVIGSVSLLPEDHFHGMRRDVVDQLRALGVSLLRWPGGNFAGEYRWQDMFLPVDMRAPLQAYTEDETQTYTHGYDMHEIDTDDFVALCHEIGAEPFITINLAWDAPEACAAWVEYCNGAPQSRYGALRAGRGHEEPYNVRFWSLGNEMGYGHMEGPMNPDEYAALGGAAARAMLAVTPGLEICASGPYSSPDRAAEWVNHSAMALYPMASYVSFHTYNHYERDFTCDIGIRKAYEQALAAVEENISGLRALRAVTPGALRISYDEWNMWAAWFRQGNALEGLFTARMLHAMLTESSGLGAPLMCYFQPVGEGAIDVYPDRAALAANGQAFALLKAHKGAALCRIEGSRSYEAVASVKNGALSVSLINASYDDEAAYALKNCGAFAGARGLRADDLLPGSRFDDFTPDVQAAEGEARVTLPPRSVVLLQFRL